MRPGSVHSLRPAPLTRAGRPVHCPGCGSDVAVIEIDLTGRGITSMRPDLCGDCQHLARTLEPELELDPGRELVGRYHAAGGDTERAAAHAVAPRSGTQRANVLEALRAAGEHGATDYELWQTGIGVRPHVAGTRREELISDGWPIVDSGERRPTDTGALAIVWRLDSVAPA